MNIVFSFVICNGSDAISIIRFITRRLRGALGFRAIGRRVRRSGVFALAMLGVITILVFGTLICGAVCTGLLVQSAFARNGFLGRNRLGIVGNGLRDRGHNERQYQAQNGGSAQNACQYTARRFFTLLSFF